MFWYSTPNANHTEQALDFEDDYDDVDHIATETYQQGHAPHVAGVKRVRPQRGNVGQHASQQRYVLGARFYNLYHLSMLFTGDQVALYLTMYRIPTSIHATHWMHPS